MKLAYMTILVLPLGVFAAAARFDVQPPQKRLPIVEKSQRYAAPAVLDPLPADLKSPFSPPGFDKPDEEEEKARAAAAAVASGTDQKPEAAKPSGDMEILKAVAQYITPSGTIVLGGQPILLFRQKKMRIGDKFSITYEGRQIEVEVTEISRNSYTLRFNRAEISRSIK